MIILEFMKLKTLTYTSFLAGLMLIFLLNCKKEPVKTTPIVTISDVINITATSASSGGVITSDGGNALTASGVCWSKNQNPTISDNKTIDGTSIGSYSSVIIGLTQGTTYYVKAYATNSIGTGYSTQSSFITLALAPILTSSNLSALTSSSVNCGGNITSDGGSPVIARGVCWSTSQNPTISNNKTTDGTGTGTFTSSITGLTPGTTYSFRAYATNSIGTSYGNELITTTLAASPVLTTTAISTFTSTTAVSGGNITSNGGVLVTYRGVCWSTSSSPTISNSKTIDGTGSGSFTSSITGLTPNTTYYVRAYATNSIGTSYGNELILITSAGITLEWVNPGQGDIVSTYHYTNGVRSGQAFYQNFNVLNESGEISINIQESSINLTKNTLFNVEKGKQYKLSVIINYTSQSGIETATKCQTFVFSSLNCTTTKEIYLYQVRVQVGGPYPYSYYACPGSLNIGDVSISLLN
jgi:hypothetical protein